MAALDDVAVLVGALVVPDALLAVGFARDDRLDFLVFEEGAKRFGMALSRRRRACRH
jgi:hypothetical protein